MTTTPPDLLPAGPHGDDARQLAGALGLDPSTVLDLSASLNPFAPDVAAAAAPHLGALHRYPDAGDRRTATEALATALAVDPARVLLTNGGAEAIALVATDLGRGWVDEPDFSLYRRHLPVVEPGGPRFRSDPHNPTGLLAGPRDRAAVWDEAFYPLAAGRWTRGDRDQGGAVVVGSLTKVFACPGLRLGYVLAPPGGAGLVRRLADAQPRWSVNGLALAVLPELLDGSDPARWTASVAAARGDLVGVLRGHGLRPSESQANFVLVEGVGDLRTRLAVQGVVVRDCTSFGLPDAVRIAVPGEEGLARLDAALAAGWHGPERQPSPGGQEGGQGASHVATIEEEAAG